MPSQSIRTAACRCCGRCASPGCLALLTKLLLNSISTRSFHFPRPYLIVEVDHGPYSIHQTVLAQGFNLLSLLNSAQCIQGSLPLPQPCPASTLAITTAMQLYMHGECHCRKLQARVQQSWGAYSTMVWWYVHEVIASSSEGADVQVDCCRHESNKWSYRC